MSKTNRLIAMIMERDHVSRLTAWTRIKRCRAKIRRILDEDRDLREINDVVENYLKLDSYYSAWILEEMF